jgi:3-(3-hydroxy-phenyl)propionate hydroxylase
VSVNPVYDVAIVGCGPVGALTANLLGKAGLRTLVVEREIASYPLPRAVHLDHEMMRLFADVGLLDAVVPLMFATDGHIHIGADGGMIRYLGSVGDPRPFTFSNDYFFYQPELEAALRAGLVRYPHVELRLGAGVSTVAQDGEAVTLTLEDGQSARARYLVGCDGARSTVRKELGVGLDDLDFEEPWLVVDAEVDGPISFPDFGGVPAGADLQRLSVMLCDPRRPATIVPGRGNHRRWEFMLLPSEDDEAMTAPDVVAALVEPWVEGVPHRIVRAATYRFHGLVAERWQVGRAFLAGDAAHQTPPFFGQGMCHGMRDVANVAWKLALVLAKQADPALLGTYQTERDPHVRAVIGAAVDAGRYICELDPDLAAQRDRDLRAARGPRTAADLIPPIEAGVVEPGAGERFIQPPVAAPGAEPVPLDAMTGGGWVVVTNGRVPVSEAANKVWSALGGSTLAIGEDAIDAEGHLGDWFARHGAVAAIVRPDFYTYAAPADPAALSAAIERLGRALRLDHLQQGGLRKSA